MKKVLILFAHPALEKSRINRHLIDAISDLENVTINDLYERYPNFDIDVRREQQLLVEHDVIVFHHPFYWYSSPAMLKEWQDLVLEFGFAYGSEGIALKDKWALNAITAGGSEEAYQPDGYNRFTIRQLLTPFEQTAHLCHMRYLPPFVIYNTHKIDPSVEAEALARRYREHIISLSEGTD